ncbi:MAG: hypothetical protein ACLQU1_14375 [Bryobacteraceae bacterium]
MNLNPNVLVAVISAAGSITIGVTALVLANRGLGRSILEHPGWKSPFIYTGIRPDGQVSEFWGRKGRAVAVPKVGTTAAFSVECADIDRMRKRA